MRRTNLAVALLLAPVLAAQAPPKPAPELKQLEPLVGAWRGEGKMVEPSGVATKWTATASYAWALDGHFLREDVVFAFEGMAVPFQVHGYLGWDLENARHVRLAVSSDGHAELAPLTVGQDGSFVVMAAQQQGSMRYLQRTSFVVKEKEMEHTVDMLMSEGPSFAIASGRFARAESAPRVDFAAKAFMDLAPHADVARLCRAAGQYDVTGSMVPAPGAPAMKIRGIDAFRAVFGGTVLHARTDGEAEGMPGKYVGEAFWARDEQRGGLLVVFVSNFGEAATMEGNWTADGRLLTTGSGRLQGQSMVQRMLMQFDDKGAVKSSVGHSIVGTGEPAETFRATYAKKAD